MGFAPDPEKLIADSQKSQRPPSAVGARDWRAEKTRPVRLTASIPRLVRPGREACCSE